MHCEAFIATISSTLALAIVASDSAAYSVSAR